MSMNAKTKKALEGSIAKWKRNARARTPEIVRLSVADCPLCDLYWDSYCDGCPVALRTGEAKCRETPYIDAASAHDDWEWGDSDGGPFRTAAKKEVEFLRSLLP